ncbi:MAG: hypothetical protein JSR77_02995 [Planctomycetes bacterium]|nr:hypothetical protein [Planctomycetota bacterium]
MDTGSIVLSRRAFVGGVIAAAAGGVVLPLAAMADDTALPAGTVVGGLKVGSRAYAVRIRLESVQPGIITEMPITARPIMTVFVEVAAVGDAYIDVPITASAVLTRFGKQFKAPLYQPATLQGGPFRSIPFYGSGYSAWKAGDGVVADVTIGINRRGYRLRFKSVVIQVGPPYP